MADGSDGKPKPRVRMTSSQRREQLIAVARSLFASKGFDATTIEEIAACAKVSKPVVYEHFGSKETIYRVVVDQESKKFLDYVKNSLDAPQASSQELIERGTLAMLDYIDDWPEGFQIISRDQPLGSSAGSFASILANITSWTEGLLAEPFARHGYDPTFAALYAKALVGAVSMAGSWWLENRQLSKEQVAAHLMNLAWRGMGGLLRHPNLATRKIPATDD